MLFHQCPACDGPSPSRRQFFAGLGAAAAATLLPAPAVRAQPAKTLIDTHLHFYPPKYKEIQKEYLASRHLPPLGVDQDWSPSRVLELMDQNGIRTGVLSLAST